MHLMQLPDMVPAGIDVYRLDLDLQVEATEAWPLLTFDERARASRFVRVADRVRFAASRAAARMLLAPRVSCCPADVPLSIGVHGKPFVDIDEGAPLLNISHSGRHALVAIADANVVCEIGVDIEVCQNALEADAILDFAFTERECHEIRSAADPLQALYQCWVGKEAVLKAIGVGVPEHLKSIGVFPIGNGGLSVECALPEWACIEVMALAAPTGYAAGLAWRSTRSV